MDPLGDLEEVRVATHDHPPSIDPATAGVGEQRLQELGDATAASGRVDVPDGAAGKALPSASDGFLQVAVAVAEQLPKPLRRKWRNRDVCQCHRSSSPLQRAYIDEAVKWRRRIG